MDYQLSQFCFGTFGSPNGYKHSICFGKKETLTVCSSFDLNTNAIKLFEGGKLFSIKKGLFNNKPSLVFSIYFHAYELNSNRDGTFIGCSIICIENYMDVTAIMKYLYEYLDKLKDLNTQNSRFTVEHSDRFKLPSLSIKDTLLKTKKINIPEFDSNKINTEAKLLINCNINELKQQWNDSVFLLNKYSEIFFSSNPDLTNFVRKKNLYQVIAHTKNNPLLTSLINQLKKEKSDKIDRYKRTLQDKKDYFLSQVDNLQKNVNSIHSKKQNERKSIDFDLSKLDQYISQLEKIQKNINSSFEDLLNRFTSYTINSIKNQENALSNGYSNHLNQINDFIERLNTNVLRNEDTRENHIPNPITNTPSEVDHENNGFRYLNFKLVSIILAVLLIGSWCYFLFFYESPVQENYTDKKVIQVNRDSELPREFLNDSDLSIVNKKLKRGMTLDSIVSIVFINNPKDIESHYSSNRMGYKDLLLKSNLDLFKRENLDYILDADALLKVPCKK
jgi:hypothetical protein